MSWQVAKRVWDGSQFRGTELLMLLAIAEFADVHGRAYPAVSTLAEKCRMSTRNANMLLAKLRDSGELAISVNTGPRGTNQFRIMVGRDPLKPTSAPPLKPASPPTPEAAFTPEAGFTLKPASRTPEAGFPKPLKPTSDEPSLNHHEPSVIPGEADASPSSAEPTTGQRNVNASKSKTPRTIPPCPYQAMVDLYHEVLPELPRVRLMGDDRKKHLSSLWKFILTEPKLSDNERRATSAAEAMEWLRGYFGRARENDFVMGRVHRSAGHENWQAGLDYLCGSRGRTQVLEMTDAGATAQRQFSPVETPWAREARERVHAMTGGLVSAKPPGERNRNTPAQEFVDVDDSPDWAINAGFSSRFTAENAGCSRFNAKQFRDGRKIDCTPSIEAPSPVPPPPRRRRDGIDGGTS